MRFILPRLVERIHSSGEYAARLEEAHAMGFRVKPYRQGTLVFKPYLGSFWVHTILLVATYGLGNVVYLLFCVRGRKTPAIYLLPTYPQT